VRTAARRAALVFSTNHDTSRILRVAGAKDVHLELDSGIAPEYIPATPPKREASPTTSLLWVGRLEHRKALPLALEAMAQLGDLPLRLWVAGDGPQRAEWERRASELKLDGRVQFLGHVDHRQMAALYGRADIFLFTSLRDSFGTQLLEAMGQGLPIITLNHQGAGTFIPDDAAIKVPVLDPAETVRGIAEAICKLMGSEALRQSTGKAGWDFARKQTWDQRAARMVRYYETILSAKRGACC
jgi:glycosyltransferase involved in cell wall biosynthesis